jgi:hypothetical protein
VGIRVAWVGGKSQQDLSGAEQFKLGTNESFRI